jgi:hypothetical protein
VVIGPPLAGPPGNGLAAQIAKTGEGRSANGGAGGGPAGFGLPAMRPVGKWC